MHDSLRSGSQALPNGREALAGVSFKIDSGELAFLTGHSGAGKSSILKLIALIERPTRGQVIINNQNTAGIKPRGIRNFAGKSAWFFRITSCCMTGRSRTTWRCR
jgi:cell division transport system ATP-binding protein